MSWTCSRTYHQSGNMNYSETSLQYPNNSQSQNSLWFDALTTSAPLSANSILSDAPSLFEDDSSVSSDPSTIPSSPPFPKIKLINPLDDNLSAAAIWPNMSTYVPNKLQNHQNPERGSLLTQTRRFPKQARTSTFVDSLVDSSANMVEAIWPLSAISYKNGFGYREIIPLREFIQETLHRSGTSYSTLQVTLYYLILIKPHVLKQEYDINEDSRENSRRALLCGRRMFISALILASKYLQDRNFTAQAWSKISGLDVLEINKNEIIFLLAVDWQLHITEIIFQRWIQILSKYFSMSRLSTSVTNISYSESSSNWKSMIIGLSPQLENFNSVVKPLIRQTISTPYLSYYNLGNMGQNSSNLNVVEPFLTAFQPTPKILHPLSSGHATNRAVSDLGPLSKLGLTSHKSSITTPYKSASSEFRKPQSGSYTNSDSLGALTLSCNNSITLSELEPRSCASLHSTMKQTPTLDISMSEHLNLANSQLYPSPLKTLTSSLSCTSSPLNTPLQSFRYMTNHSGGGKIFGLNKKKLGNNKSNIFDSTNICFKDSIGLFTDTSLGRRTINSNYCSGYRDTVHPIKSSCQYPATMNYSFGSNPFSDLTTTIGSNINPNPNRYRDLVGESHSLLFSKKRPGDDIIYSPSISGIGEMKYKYSTSDTSAPRKRLCWAFEASTSLKNIFHPTLGLKTG